MIRTVKVCAFLFPWTMVAKAEVVLQTTALGYESSKAEVEYDNNRNEFKSTSVKTLDPSMGISVYSDSLMLGLSLSMDEDAKSGAVLGGYHVAPNLYVGLVLGIEKTIETEEGKVGGTVANKSEETTVHLELGPYLLYRVNSGDSILRAGVGLSRSTLEMETEEGATQSSSTFESTSLFLTGSYHRQVANQLYIGAGLQYQMSLSGDAELESGNTAADGDFKFNHLNLSILDVIVSI